MLKSNRNRGKPWTHKGISTLKNLANKNTPTNVIGFKLGRTPKAIYTKASQENISLVSSKEVLIIAR